jgi:vitamin-K-epoxide reductase (warfarin-sensitive)
MKYLVALIAAVGIVVSAMALHVHYMDPSQAPPCAVTEKFDCGAVNHSRFAVFPPRTFDEDPKAGKVHVPIATLGIIAYTAIAAFALLGWWWFAFQASLIGFMFAGFLSYLEAYILEKWCIYCLWSQGIITVLLLLTGCVLAAQRMRTRKLATVER